MYCRNKSAHSAARRFQCALGLQRREPRLPDKHRGGDASYEACGREDAPARFRQLFDDWFYVGLSELKGTPKTGIDGQKAMRHIRFIMGGFDSKHEHKEAAVRYLLDKWFETLEWTPRIKK